MAERIDQLPAAPRGGNHKYPWDEWLDGSAWELIRGTDFDCTTGALRSAAEYSAGRRQITVTIQVRGDRVYLQAQR